MVRGMDPRIRSTPKNHGSATLKNTVNSKPESRDGHGAAHVEVLVEPESEMSLAGAHHQARGPASHNIVVLPRPAIHLTTKNIFIFIFMLKFSSSQSPKWPWLEPTTRLEVPPRTISCSPPSSHTSAHKKLVFVKF